MLPLLFGMLRVLQKLDDFDSSSSGSDDCRRDAQRIHGGDQAVTCPFSPLKIRVEATAVSLPSQAENNAFII